MGRIVVEVMPKPEILDPQGKAVVGSLTQGVREFPFLVKERGKKNDCRIVFLRIG